MRQGDFYAEKLARELAIDAGVGPVDRMLEIGAGFFLLHALPDVGQAIAKLMPLLAPEGRMAFVEPNRRNPLILAQVLPAPI